MQLELTTKEKQSQDEPVTPSKAGPNQVFDTEATSNVLGGPRRYKDLNEHPLTLAFYKGRITDQQYAAGNVYRSWYETNEGTLKSCLNINIVAPKFGDYNISEAKWNAGSNLREVHKLLSRRDKIIIEMLCGRGFTPSQAVKAAGIVESTIVSPRVRESLDELVKVLKVVLGKKSITTT